ncbi:MAG: hypothetical protein Kapaf2KO_04610 [Candidatus Kapaibacteriales bacterium]
MKNILKFSFLAILSGFVMTSCDEDDSPTDPGDGGNGTTVDSSMYVSFEIGSYWVYQNEEYGGQTPEENMTRMDSVVVGSEEMYAGRMAYRYDTYSTDSTGNYSSDAEEEYYSEDNGDIYLHAISINRQLASPEVAAIVDIDLGDTWLQIRETDATGPRELLSKDILETELTLSGIDATLKDAKLVVTASNDGEEMVDVSGTMVNSVKQKLTFTLTGTAEGEVFGQTISGAVNGTSEYTLWFSDSNGLIKSDFKPFAVTADIPGFGESEIFSSSGNTKTLIRSQVSASSN